MDGRERGRLRQFVASPYFNRHAGVEALLDFILRELGKRQPKLTEERARTRVQKPPSPQRGNSKGLKTASKPTTAQSIPDLMSALMKLVNRFLAVEQLGTEEFRTEVLTIKRTKELRRHDLLENRGKRLDRKLEKHPFRDADLHLAAYEWKDINGYRLGATNRSDTGEMQAMLDHLDRYYLVEKLRHACQLTANMMIRNTHYELLFIDHVMDYLADGPGAELRQSGREPSIDCYYHILLSLREPDVTEHYTWMRYYLRAGSDRIPPEQRRDLYIFASNHCIGRLRRNPSEENKLELFELYRSAIDSGAIYQDGVINEFDYKNVVTLATNLRKDEWVEDFLETQRAFLPENARENAYGLNRAIYLHARGRLDEAARLLATVPDSNVTYHQTRVLLQVRIAYEQADQEYALNLLETFRLYTRRNQKISTKDRRAYLNYIRYAKQVINLRFQEDFMDAAAYRTKMTTLRGNIDATPEIIGLGWLRQVSQLPQPA